MDAETEQKFAKLEEKIDLIYISTEKTRKYFQWTLIVTVVTFVIPLIVAAIALPSFLTNYTSQLQGAGLGI